MYTKIIDKWHPIIKRLDATDSLTYDQMINLCDYCENHSIPFMLHEMQTVKIDVGSLDPKRSMSDRYRLLLPMLLKIIYEVMIELNKDNIPLTFSHEPEPEPEIVIENNAVTFKSTSDFETKYSSINILDQTVSYLNDMGIDAFKKSEEALIKQTILNLVELGKQKGELVIHSNGNSLQLISETSSPSKSMILTYKIKK